mmetsp:Transcript_20447/g.36697  ORF Transcript_20447/g.36697 Transcript_20447/m.36697 type:complete len:336 (+) Transcript_20447:71-1078(+)|eukprot:CAMPEP_0197655244 /NCGR_PEP_ID=MMETSP1338-20131121/39339_1 /TAXON_ID=43686 ORGANISM="Pelagodinium beii, Strain RCC1491" /NCGR_SAMPLE_ID=MMETSP1338 /ASSEMBLY_ACC=CAM_ASM_000754 /LENGTH=335 /DNA_ID=CAMNT_0043230857 /DNA_START=45 /DNA_END=1052 /DNA_ORIENTATION=-
MAVMDTRLGEVIEKTPGGKCTLCCLSVIALLLMILLPTSVKQVDRLHSGLLKNGISGEVDLTRSYLPGRYFAGFYQDFVMFPTTLNTIEFSDEDPEEGVEKLGTLRSRDQDGKQIFLDVSIQYRIIPQEVAKIFKDMTNLYEDVYTSELRGGLQRATNYFPIAKAWTDFAGVQATMKQTCDDVLKPRYAECWGLQLWGVRLQDQYENALVKTQVRKQAQKTEEARKIQEEYKAETKVVLAEYVKNIRIVTAAGEANKTQIERAAVSRAQANVVAAYGDVLKLVKQTVAVNKTGSAMTSEQLIQYQRLLMLTGATESQLVVKSPGSYMQSLNAMPR